ncbi:Eukaryotic initiation factor 4A-I [Lobosporangium transversale]|uniref:p-loop containing nucleoside triphosphate hydrolase protein n=1 Tax=Lobosporangium transversale TaxID=64571 RepID=A0A1Y2GFA5_9FUNG|nr:P-loop containing nucleoside triphosphate hydrolase protein [Lobosporangium transversale]KAF9914555.1 Eukaryotic initiation factor 4A-I [Lobosporangium transversale]ORZ09119.1 P-loop containing nucleoside triphosphate hydrolase protein [Lobosporangium transversale]|eukprot:XP_021878746.1 P-loop containing nucleoside triphosphate hydrolase protein [Lobosporangium transversale]
MASDNETQLKSLEVLEYKEETSWEDLGLDLDLLRGIYNYGLIIPRHVQHRAIPAILHGHDVIIDAPDMAGKTIALILSALQAIDISNPECQVLILVPVPDMVPKIHHKIQVLTQFMMQLITFECMSARSALPVHEVISRLRQGTQLIVSTPGRVYPHLLGHNSLRSDMIRIVMLDEVEEILSRGFETIVTDILAHLQQNVQLVLATPTLKGDPAIERILGRLKDLVHITQIS